MDPKFNIRFKNKNMCVEQVDKAHFIRSGNECEQTEDSEARSQ